MYVKHLIEDILDLQRVIPVTEESKVSREELEDCTEGQLEEIKYEYLLINDALSNGDILTSLN